MKRLDDIEWGAYRKGLMVKDGNISQALAARAELMPRKGSMALASFVGGFSMGTTLPHYWDNLAKCQTTLEARPCLGVLDVIYCSSLGLLQGKPNDK